MTDYPELYRQLAREILKHEGKIEGSAKDFTVKLAEKLRAKGYQLTPEIEAELSDYLEAMQAAIKTGIETAVDLSIGAIFIAQANGRMNAALQSQTVAKLAEQAFDERWPDGLRLSDRLWNFNETARTGLTDVLRKAAKTGASVNKTIYAMQRTIERAAGGQRFKIVEQYADDWVKELHDAATQMIHDPQSRELWNATVADVQERIENLKATGTRHAAERVFDQIKQAVAKGREELADKAVKWWLYDKQLYGLKRIARTEMATAMHKAMIAGTENDDTIIGYQWRLSASHPVVDICDYYASIEMGLGKGVFTKDAVPQHKAHPHCMCLLIPRVTHIKEKGSKDYATFIKNLAPDQQKALLPKWAAESMDAGAELGALIRPDGFGLITRQQAVQTKLWPPYAHLEDLPGAEAKSRVAELLQSKAFARFYQGGGPGKWPVSVLSVTDRTLLGADSQLVWLSRVSLDDHKAKHHDVGLSDYRRIPDIIEHGEVYQSRGRRYVLLQVGDMTYRGAIKVTQDGKENYFLSLIQQSDAKADKEVRSKYERIR